MTESSADVPGPPSGGRAKPQPLSSLTASAQRIKTGNIPGSRHGDNQSWQEDAWNMYDLVGEERFLANTLAGRMSQAKLFVGKLTDEEGVDDPEPVEDQQLQELIDAIGGGNAGLAERIFRLGINLFVAGEGWLVGVPTHKIPGHEDEDARLAAREAQDPAGVQVPDLLDFLDETTMDELTWYALSIGELSFTAGNKASLSLPENNGRAIEFDVNDLFLIRIWRPHPKNAWEADAPTRSTLPILRELVGLTMHISAQVDSRLAGAGILFVPDEAERAMRQKMNVPVDSDRDPMTEALMEAMITPINNRASASAVVPLVVTAPQESIQYFKYMSFSQPLDTEARPLREEAIQRLALGQDAPPELLLGTAGMNHWGAWLVREDVVTTHLEPPLALICDALTTQYLRPMMQSLGYSPEQAEQYVVWYDVSKLIVRPNRSQDAASLYEAGALSADSLRQAAGFDENDAPIGQSMDPTDRIVFQMVQADPALIKKPGVEVLRDQIGALVEGKTAPELPEPEPVPPGLEQPEDQNQDDGPSGGQNQPGGGGSGSGDNAPDQGDGEPSSDGGNSPSGSTASGWTDHYGMVPALIAKQRAEATVSSGLGSEVSLPPHAGLDEAQIREELSDEDG